MTLEELLQWLQISESSGTLLFRCPNADIHWDIVDGHVVGVQAPGLDLWAAAEFGSDNWEKAKSWALRDNSTPAQILVKVGLLKPAGARQWMSEAGKRSLHTIFMWDDGWFLFERDMPMPQVGPEDGVPVEHLLLDVAREYDERNKVKARLGDPNVWIEAVPGAEIPGLSDEGRRLLVQGLHIAELPWLLPEDFWEVSKELSRLVDEGKAVTVPTEEETVNEPVKRYQEAIVAQRSFRYEEAALAFEEAITALWDDPFSREIVAKWVDRYMAMAESRLVSAKRTVRPVPQARPQPGDAFAAYILRVLKSETPLQTLRQNLPFHPFFVTRSVRRLAASGDIELV